MKGTPRPTQNDLVAMVSECCPLRAPETEERHLMQTAGGRRLLFEPLKAMRAIAKRWKQASKAAKLKLLELPWMEEWIRKNADLYQQARVGSGRLVSKDAKITILATIYAEEDGPRWKDEIPIEMDDGVWSFKPVQWLDDVANNWTHARSAVSLTEAQKHRLEALPWFRAWLRKLKDKRARRRARKE